jgi:hypothetical protein
LVNGQIRPWQAIDGRYRSEALGIALAAEGPLPRVYDRAGRAVRWPSERAQAQATLEAENARLRAELDRLRGQSGTNSGD